MHNVSVVPCNSFNGKPIFKYIDLPIPVSIEQPKSGLNINFEFLKYIIHRPYVIFFSDRKFFALSREQCTSCIYKNNCWYHECAIEYRLIGFFLKIIIIIIIIIIAFIQYMKQVKILSRVDMDYLILERKNKLMKIDKYI